MSSNRSTSSQNLKGNVEHRTTDMSGSAVSNDWARGSCRLTTGGRTVTSRNVTISNRPLTDLQQAIVDFIWKAGPSTAEDIRHGLASSGQRIIITAGVPFGTPGSTNVLLIVRLVGDELERYHRETNGE